MASWFARASVAAVFALNVSCAVSFITEPERYVAGFELSGVPGMLMVRGVGILFLMWNATFPPVILRPDAHISLFGVVLAQQAIGLAGESWLMLELPSGHAALFETGIRFVVFDGVGLAVMVLAYALLRTTRERADG